MLRLVTSVPAGFRLCALHETANNVSVAYLIQQKLLIGSGASG
jgi:hypothetical protein